jgi:hypothetical protein
MSKFIVVSFYTKDNGYDREAAKLIESLKAFGVDYYVEAIDSLGNWMTNAHHTHGFIRKALDLYPERPVVWTDADSVLRRYPGLFDTLDCDFAAHVHNWIRWGKTELLCGTMYFANNTATRGFLEDCARMNLQFPNRRGAFNVAETFKVWKDRLRFQELPPEYCKIYDLMSNVPDPVFEHFQASRRFRRHIPIPIPPAKAMRRR